MTTYASFVARSLSLVVVLPFLLTGLTTEEIHLWYLFSAIASFQLLIDLGFSPTFSRAIAYAMAGTDVRALASPRGDACGSPDWHAVEKICATMRYVYVRVAMAWSLLLLSVGTLAVLRPIAALEDGVAAWAAWMLVVLSSVAGILNIAYSSYLQGVNEIPVLRRWEVVTAVGATVTTVLAITLGGDLLAVVAAHQAWLIANAVRNRWLSRNVLGGRLKSFSGAGRDRDVMNAILPSAWRTAIGAFASFGLVQASGIIYSQFASPSAAATYLLALRLMQWVSQFSQTPFYSKLPALARMYSEGRRADLVRASARAMRLAYLGFVAGFAALGALGAPLLEHIGSNAAFPNSLLWALLGAAYYFERYGAMHINLFGITNRIINHIANSGAGLIYLAVAFAGFGHMGIYAFPVALIAGNAGFYAWYAARHSYSAFGVRFLSFERTTMIPYLGLFLLSALAIAYL